MPPPSPLARSTPPVGAPECKEKLYTAEALAAADYSGSTKAWRADNGSGALMGYSVHEDSRIYNTWSCATRNPLY